MPEAGIGLMMGHAADEYKEVNKLGRVREKLR